MSFGHPKVLWFGIVLLPLLGLFFWATWRKRQALIQQFVQHKALALLTLGASTARQKLRRVLLFISVSFLLLAVAGPQWGFVWEEASQRGRDIVVAIDTSRSMLAEDIPPNRLRRAKLAALDLLRLGKFDRFGLVAFAGTAFLQCPLTFDDEAFRQSVEILEPGIIPQGGTAIGPAIQSARDAFGEESDENHRILILFTDGEDHDQDVMQTVERAAGEGLRIFTVGAGTPGGELLRVRDEKGNQVFVKDEAGNVVKSRLNEQLLQQIATRGNGFYLNLQAANAMDALYAKGLAPLPTSERSTKLMKRLKEQYYWPLALAILLLILELFIPEQKRAPKKAEPLPNAVPATAVILLILFGGPSLHASPAKAQRHYQNGEYKSALSEYQELLAKSPNDPRLHYNAGAAAYQAGKFDAAVKEFQSAAASPDLDLQQQSFYNLANSEFRVGEANSNVQERTALWEQALQHYDAALKLNSTDKDAEFNRDLVRKKLEELKQQQSKNEQQQNKDNKDENKKDKDDQSKQDQQNKDQQQQDNKSQEKKDSEQQQNDQSKPQPQPENKPEEKEQPQSSQSKEDQTKQDQANQSQQGKESDQKPEGEQGEFAQLGKMTPAQAKQLLDAQRNDEKALLFIPPQRKSSSQNRSFKDW